MAAKKILSSIVIASVLAGCATMLPHTRISDERSEKLGMAAAATDMCFARGHISAERAGAHKQAIMGFLSSTVHSKEAVERGFQTMENDYGHMPSGQWQSNCNELNAFIPRAVSDLNAQTREARQWAATGGSTAASFMEINRSLQSFNQNMASHNLNATTPNSNSQSSFNSQSTSPRHYLINTGSGQIQCTAMSSGYVNCR